MLSFFYYQRETSPSKLNQEELIGYANKIIHYINLITYQFALTAWKRQKKEPLCKLFSKPPVAQRRGRAVSARCSFHLWSHQGFGRFYQDPFATGTLLCSPSYPKFHYEFSNASQTLFLSQELTKQAGSGEYEVILVTSTGVFWGFFWAIQTFFPSWAQRMCWAGTGHTSSGHWEPAHPEKTKRDKGKINRTQQRMREISPGGKSLLIWECPRRKWHWWLIYFFE